MTPADLAESAQGARPLAEPRRAAPALEGLTDEEALRFSRATGDELSALLAAAAAKRDAAFGRTLTFSPKAFLPLTNLCRDFCDYCSFRRSPGQRGEWTMHPDETLAWLRRGADAGATEALLCLGDRPETAFPSYTATLAAWGFRDTCDYVAWASERALELGLLPHTNAGLLTEAELVRLRCTNPSLGLMLESASERLLEPGMPHANAPDKHPALRLAMMRTAGALRVPFTSGVLLGIGETPEERVEALLALRDLHREHGHLQELIVQNFTARPHMRLRRHPEPAELDVLRTLALARLLLPAEVSVQVPPNLNPGRLARLVEAGINDFGGISAVTPDYVNPSHAWPVVAELEGACSALGFALRPRAVIYPSFARRAGWLDPRLVDPVAKVQARLEAPSHRARLGLRD